MKGTTSFTVTLGESLKTINDRLANVYSADYEKGTLEVHTQRASHVITFRLKDSELPYTSIPGTRQSWHEDYFPNIIRFVTDRPFRTFEFPSDAFTLNDVAIASSAVTVNDQFSFEISLTGNSGQITGDNTIAITRSIYGLNGGSIDGILWNGERASELTPRRGTDNYYRNLGGRLRMERLVVHKAMTPETTLAGFVKKRVIRVLDTSFVQAGDQPSISGWLYVLFEDDSSFIIDYIDPAPDSVLQNVASEIVVKFNSPVDPGYTSDFQSRIYITNHTGTGQPAPTAATFDPTRKWMKIEPAAESQVQGLHQLYINMDGVYSNGQRYSAPSTDVWSTYYVKSLLIPEYLSELLDVDIISTPPTNGQSLVYNGVTTKWEPSTVSGGGGGTGTGGAPTNGPYVAWQADVDLTNERIAGGGTYIDLTNDGTNLTFDVNTADLAGAFVHYNDYLSHTGNSGVHFLIGDIWLTESQITDLGDYATNPNLNLLSGGLTGHTGNTGIHFLVGDIWVTESQITDLGDYATNANLNLLSGGLTGHTGNTGYHFLVGDIWITENQITDLGDYATNSNLNLLSGGLTGHTGQTGIHFQMADIWVTESQITDLGDYATNANLDLLSGGHTGLTGSIGAASFITVVGEGSPFGSSRALSAGSHITINDLGAGSDIEISVNTASLDGVFALDSELAAHTALSNPHGTSLADLTAWNLQTEAITNIGGLSNAAAVDHSPFYMIGGGAYYGGIMGGLYFGNSQYGSAGAVCVGHTGVSTGNLAAASLLITPAGASSVNVPAGQNIGWTVNGGSLVGGTDVFVMVSSQDKIFVNYDVEYSGVLTGTGEAIFGSVAFNANSSIACTGIETGTGVAPSAILASKAYVDDKVAVVGGGGSSTPVQWSQWLDSTQFRVHDNGAGTFASTNPGIAYSTTNASVYSYYDLGQSADEYLFHRSVLPPNMDQATGVGIRLHYTHSSTGVGDVVMYGYIRSLLNSDHYGTAGVFAETSATQTMTSKSAHSLVIQDLGYLSTSCRQLDHIKVVAGRLGTNGSDNWTGSVRFLGLELYGWLE